MSERAPLTQTADEIAAHWFSRKRAGTMTTEEARELEVWLSAAPEHRAAFDNAGDFWGAVDAIRADPTVLALREEALQMRAPPRRLVWGALAASALLAAGVGVYAVQSDLFAKPTPQEYRTGVGQTVTVALRDGSTATLDTDTIVRVLETKKERRIELARGQAFFRVAPDAQRPFIVSAGVHTVTATGTAFDVRMDADRVQVTLVEGKVTVAEPEKERSARMSAGSRLIAQSGEGWMVAKIDPTRETSWMRGQLIFLGEPLGHVVAEMNRYSPRKILIADPRIEDAPISGAFNTGDVETFVYALKDYGVASVALENETEVRLGAP